MTARSLIDAGLPEPDADSVAHSHRVAAYLCDRMSKSGGSISFAEFMHEALYAPGLGYYSAGAAKLGRDGDFVTAPEISPLFGYVLARQIARVLGQLDGGDVLEPGAGSGALAVSMLRKLGELGALPERYQILEVSADLRDRQKTRLAAEIPQLIDRVQWIEQMPDEFSGVIVANEVADAMPVERFRIREDELEQQRVACADDRFVWQHAAAPPPLQRAIREVETDIGRSLEDGYVSEVSLWLTSWIGQLSRCVTRGMILLFDYGVSRHEYYAADRDAGWLRCQFRHRTHDDPLILPGIQDLSAWVDFTAVATAAVAEGMEVAGYTTQAGFLLHGGLEQELADFAELPIQQQVQLSAKVKWLTLPAEMGENFKCIGLCRGDVEPLPAYRGADMTHLL